mmetsp:Transcript_15149/g.32309  ORF Transcript_15149/g.32309 Transcript_15149/m.32309 type:complete len:104 (+) Transcript_15149:426-737(+)
MSSPFFSAIKPNKFIPHPNPTFQKPNTIFGVVWGYHSKTCRAQTTIEQFTTRPLALKHTCELAKLLKQMVLLGVMIPSSLREENICFLCERDRPCKALSKIQL